MKKIKEKKLPEGIPAPPKGWVYVGKGDEKDVLHLDDAPYMGLPSAEHRVEDATWTPKWYGNCHEAHYALHCTDHRLADQYYWSNPEPDFSDETQFMDEEFPGDPWMVEAHGDDYELTMVVTCGGFDEALKRAKELLPPRAVIDSTQKA